MDMSLAAAGEAEMVRRARLGEPAAWTALVQAHGQPIFRLAYLMTGSPEDAEDVAQETFLRAYRSLDHFDSERPLRPWLLKISANLARNRRRSLGRYWAALSRAHYEVSLAGNSPVDSFDQVQQFSRALWDAVRRLKSSDQQVIYLRFFLDLSVEDSAATMEIPAGTVKSRLNRALGRLRRVIEKDFPELKEWSDGTHTT